MYSLIFINNVDHYFLFSFLSLYFPPSSLGVIRVKLSEHGFVVGGSASFRDNDSVFLADSVHHAAGQIQVVLILAHGLDAYRGLLLFCVADSPLDDAEVDIVTLTCVQALVEGLCVEQVPLQADCETLQVQAFIVTTIGCGHRFVRLSQHLDVGVVRSQLSVCRNASTHDLSWQICLLRERLGEVTFDNSLNEWQQLTAKVVRSLRGHLSWQVIHTGEENIRLSQLVVDLLLESLVDRIIQQERLFDAREPARKLN